MNVENLLSYNIYKYITQNIHLPTKFRLEAHYCLGRSFRRISLVRYVNKCDISNHKRSYYGDFRLSRISLRTLISRRFIPGVTKSSW